MTEPGSGDGVTVEPLVSAEQMRAVWRDAVQYDGWAQVAAEVNAAHAAVVGPLLAEAARLQRHCDELEATR